MLLSDASRKYLALMSCDKSDCLLCYLRGKAMSKLTWFLAGVLAASSTNAQSLTSYQNNIVAEVLLDAIDYCSWKADNFESEEVSSVIVQRGFSIVGQADEEQFVILDTSKLNCGVGDTGTCGSAGCAIWIIGPTEQTVRLGKLVRIPEGYDDKGPRMVYCGEEDAWEDCVDVKDILK